MTVLRWLIAVAIMSAIAALHREMGHAAPKNAPVLALHGSGISSSTGGRFARRSAAAINRPGRKPGIMGKEHMVKLLYFDDFRLGVLKNDAVVDVSAAVKDIPHTGPGDLMNGLIERW